MERSGLRLRAHFRRLGTLASPLVSVLASVLALALALAPGAGASVIVEHPAAFEVSAFAGTLAWSQLQRGTEPDGDRFVLMRRSGGSTGPVPIRPSREPFDVDLGPSASAGSVAIYPRCRVQRRRYDCGIELFDLAANTLLAPPGGDLDRCLELAPSTWEGAIAVSRRPAREPARPRERRPQRRGVSGGCRAGLYALSPGRPPLRLDGRAPLYTDSGEGLVVAGFVESRRPTGPTVSSIVVYNLAAGTETEIARGRLDRQGRGRLVSLPVIDGTTVYYSQNRGGRRSQVLGLPLAPGGTKSVTGGLVLDSLGVDRGSLFYTNQRGVLGPRG